MTGSKGLVHWSSETWWEWIEIAALPRAPPRSRLRQLWSRKGDLQRVWNQDRKAVWDQVGLSHYRHEGLVMVQDEARLMMISHVGGHQCSETWLTGESRFHISTPQGIWTQVPCDGKQRVSPLDQWDMVRMKWDCRLSTLLSFFTAPPPQLGSHREGEGERHQRIVSLQPVVIED